MNIVTNTGSVACIVVGSKNLHLVLHATGNFHYTRKKICRVLFKPTDFSFGIITGSIKISKGSKTHSFKLVVPGHKALYFQLGKTVIIFRIFWMVFVYRQIFWSTKNCRRRRKNHFFAAIFYGRIHNVKCSGNIINTVFFRINHTFACSLKCRKMNKGIKALGKSSIKIIWQKNVSINKTVLRKKVAS